MESEIELLNEIRELREENEELRRLLFKYKADTLSYHDDGEMQDNTQVPYIDYKRDLPSQIALKIHNRNIKRIMKDYE